MRPIHALLLAIAAVPLYAGTLAAYHAHCESAASAASAAPSTLTVSGQGLAVAAPDLVTFQIALQTRAEGTEAALPRSNARVGRITEALRGAGVDAADIQLASVVVSAAQPLEPDEGSVSGRLCSADHECAMEEICDQGRCVFGQGAPAPATAGGSQTVDLTLAVTVRDASRLAPILVVVAATDDGVTVMVHSLTLADPRALAAEARARAIADAQARAEALAIGLGVTLGSPTTITEDASVSDGPYSSTARIEARDLVSVTYRLR